MGHAFISGFPRGDCCASIGQGLGAERMYGPAPNGRQTSSVQLQLKCSQVHQSGFNNAHWHDWFGEDGGQFGSSIAQQGTQLRGLRRQCSQHPAAGGVGVASREAFPTRRRPKKPRQTRGRLRQEVGDGVCRRVVCKFPGEAASDDLGLWTSAGTRNLNFEDALEE